MVGHAPQSAGHAAQSSDASHAASPQLDTAGHSPQSPPQLAQVSGTTQRPSPQPGRLQRPQSRAHVRHVSLPLQAASPQRGVLHPPQSPAQVAHVSPASQTALPHCAAAPEPEPESQPAATTQHSKTLASRLCDGARTLIPSMIIRRVYHFALVVVLPRISHVEADNMSDAEQDLHDIVLNFVDIFRSAKVEVADRKRDACPTVPPRSPRSPTSLAVEFVAADVQPIDLLVSDNEACGVVARVAPSLDPQAFLCAGWSSR